MLFAKLNGKIHEVSGTQKSLAESIGVTPSYLSKRLKGKVPFSVKDIHAICKELDIPINSIGEYFFN